MADIVNESDCLLRERQGAVAILTLNRPAKLNSMDLTLQRDLFEELQRLHEDDSCRAIVLTGAGRAFSSGQDLSERKAILEHGVPDLGASLDHYYNPLVRLARDGGKPIIAALNGMAAGAGANLALACDIVIAARSAKILQPFARIGLIPDCGGTWMLPRLVGDSRARALALLGQEISAEKAAEWGLVWSVVDDADLLDEATSIGEKLAQSSAPSIRMMKQAFATSWDNSLAEQLAVERDLQRTAGVSPHYREGVFSFFEKRPPRFSNQSE